MSSFSSVVRKPGQKIVPKAAPRRNIQRRGQKPAAPTTSSTLTPESTPQDSAEQIVPSPEEEQVPMSNAALVAASTLTPPPTSTDQSSGEDQGTSARDVTPEQPIRLGVASAEARKESTVPVVATTAPSPNTRQRQPVEVTDQVSVSPDDVAATVSRQSGHGPPNAKRRKVALPEAVPVIAVPSIAQPIARSGIRRRSLGQQTNNHTAGTDADLQNVSSQLRTISELANSIETHTRTSRSRTGQRSTADSDTDYEALDAESLRSRSRASRSAAIREVPATAAAQAVGGSKRGRARHRRGQTPEDADAHQIDTKETSMADLVNDSGLGKRSETGKRLDDEWDHVKARWDQKLEQNRSNAKMKSTQRKEAREAQGGDTDIAPAMPQMMVVDGQIVATEESRLIDFSHNAEARANIIDESQIQTDERIYNYVNQNRIGKHAGLRNPTKWTNELTDKLYQGLRVFGTDFELISKLFGEGWTRRQIKAKFVREERQNLTRVKEALAEREQIDLQGYGEMINGGVEGLRDPKEIEAELEAEERKIREEYEKSKRLDHFAEEDEADQPLDSIETDHPIDGEPGRTSTTPAAETNRFTGLAERVVRKAMQPRKKQPQKQREQTGTSRTSTVGRKGTRGKKPLEGVEERIGNIGDVEL